MGCLFPKVVKRESESNKKVYSWDLRRDLNLDRDDYVFEAIIDQERIKLPGSVNGQQFLIQNCMGSTLYVLDHMNAVSIYDCIDCKIVLGPVKGSVYIGGCKNCVCVTACGQFRIRDSKKIAIFLHCETQPAIESSSSISFGNYKLYYNSLDDHLKMAYLNLKKKNWKVVHDFTPLQSEINWKFIENDNASDYVKDPISDEIAELLRNCGQKWEIDREEGEAASRTEIQNDQITD